MSDTLRTMFVRDGKKVKSNERARRLALRARLATADPMPKAISMGRLRRELHAIDVWSLS